MREELTAAAGFAFSCRIRNSAAKVSNSAAVADVISRTVCSPDE
jgi:hypothetical protein